MTRQAEVTALHGGGYALTTEALSPKLGGGLCLMWWTGPDPAYPEAAVWSANQAEAATYPTEAALGEAFATLDSPLYELAAQRSLPGLW